MTHFNQLTPAEAERLAMLAEECGEVIQVIGKILRHGYDSYHPDQQGTKPDLRFTNRKALGAELCDLFSVADIICATDRVPLPDSEKMISAWGHKLRYAHHQETRS
jgi:hypothetical protein